MDHDVNESDVSLVLWIEHDTDLLAEGAGWKIVCEAGANNTAVAVSLCNLSANSFDASFAVALLNDRMRKKRRLISETTILRPVIKPY